MVATTNSLLVIKCLPEYNASYPHFTFDSLVVQKGLNTIIISFLTSSFNGFIVVGSKFGMLHNLKKWITYKSQAKKQQAMREDEHQLPSKSRGNRAEFFSGFKEDS